MKRFWILGAVGVVALVVAAYFAINYRRFLIWYHLNRMQTAREEIYEKPSTVGPGGLVGYGSQELFDRRDHHRDRLVDLGYLFHATYEMENVPDTDEAHRELWQQVTAAFPDNRHVTLSYPDNALEVWDAPSRRDAWEAFVKKHNVANFADRPLNKNDRQPSAADH